MKKVLTVLLSAALILQAGMLSVFAGSPEEEKQVITISGINVKVDKDGSLSFVPVIESGSIPPGSIEIISEELTVPAYFVIGRKDVEIEGGKYSYKLVLKANGQLTFDNDLEILYQGVSGRYKLHYEIVDQDRHIMIVTGNFDNLMAVSPLLERFRDRISGDSYFYELFLKTNEGFTFANALRFLFDGQLYGYTIKYSYDLASDTQSIEIDRIGEAGQSGSEAEELKTEAEVDKLQDPKGAAEAGAAEEPAAAVEADKTEETEAGTEADKTEEPEAETEANKAEELKAEAEAGKAEAPEAEAAGTKKESDAVKAVSVSRASGHEITKITKITRITRITSAVRALSVKWKRSSGADGYRIQVSTSKKFNKGTKNIYVRKGSRTSAKIKGLKKNKRYYVRICPYKTVSGKKVYSGWSDAVSARTK